MVIPFLGESWTNRLQRLKALESDQPDGPIWLWSIRIRILEFLIARYGAAQDESRQRSHQAALASTDTIDDSAPLEIRPMRHLVSGIDNPPKTTAQIAVILDAIEQSNRESRSTTWIGPPPEVVWEWWRESMRRS